MPAPRSLHLTPLTPHQKRIINAYLYHDDQVTDLMNTIVDLRISIARERDEPGLGDLKAELETAEEDLQAERQARRRKLKEVEAERERLKKAGTSGARGQGLEMGRLMGEAEDEGLGMRMMR